MEAKLRTYLASYCIYNVVCFYECHKVVYFVKIIEDIYKIFSEEKILRCKNIKLCKPKRICPNNTHE